MPLTPFTTRLEAQWIASLLGIIMGSTLLCNFNKGYYSTAVMVFYICIVFDGIAIIFWWVQDY